MSTIQIDAQLDLDAAYNYLYSLCETTLGLTTPNPNVAAAIYSADGKLISDGYHDRKASLDHAEVVAIKKAGSLTAGATLVVSLEPCSHQGATGPCTTAILEAGISRVIYAVADPNPVAAGGAEILKSAGVMVEKVESESLAFIQRAWLHKIKKQRPLMIWKVATTVDGKIAAIDGSSQWITSEPARNDVQKLRAQSDAILIGSGTALRDNPHLIPRGFAQRPIRMVMGERDIPVQHHLNDDQAETMFVRNRDINKLMSILNAKSLNQVLVEAGPELGTALAAAGLIDELVIYQAPKILGTGATFISDFGVSTLAEHLPLELLTVERIGSDIKSHYRLKRSV